MAHPSAGFEATETSALKDGENSFGGAEPSPPSSRQEALRYASRCAPDSSASSVCLADGVEPRDTCMLPPSSNSREVVIPLQKWRGYVAKIRSDSFLAIVTDQTSPGPDEEVEFDRSEVSPDDLEFLVEGAIFYWLIGYRDRNGSRQRVSEIRFRRLPVWCDAEIESARIKAIDLGQRIGWITGQ